VETEMSVPTQAHHEKSTDLRELVDEIRGQVEAKGRIDWVDGKNLLRMIDALHAERTLAPATQTGDVRKVSAAMIRKSLQGCKRTFDVRLNGLTDEGIEVLCSVLSGELNAELAASAAPTHLALFDKLRDEWNGEIEPGQPCFDTFSACLAGLSDAIEKSRAAAPPATQTGDVRKGE
jgi:hypothetical protein